MELKGIYTPIKEELKAVERTIQNTVQAEEKFVNQIVKYIFSSPGKMLRPALVLLCAKVGGKNQKPAIKLASAIEMIHTATLVQDDVIDRAELRRGYAPLHKKWGKDLAILFGDYLYARAFGILTSLGNYSILQRLSQATRLICLGEIEQLKRANTLFTEKIYLRIIERKTASLFSACGETGAILGDGSSSEVKACKGFGLNFGMAFQIVDDCLDFISSEKKIGKSVGQDQKMGKVTLPIIYNSVSRAKEIAGKFFASAKKSLESIQSGTAKQTLFTLCDYVASSAN